MFNINSSDRPKMDKVATVSSETKHNVSVWNTPFLCESYCLYVKYTVSGWNVLSLGTSSSLYN